MARHDIEPVEQLVGRLSRSHPGAELHPGDHHVHRGDEVGVEAPSDSRRPAFRVGRLGPARPSEPCFLLGRSRPLDRRSHTDPSQAAGRRLPRRYRRDPCVGPSSWWPRSLPVQSRRSSSRVPSPAVADQARRPARTAPADGRRADRSAHRVVRDRERSRLLPGGRGASGAPPAPRRRRDRPAAARGARRLTALGTPGSAAPLEDPAAPGRGQRTLRWAVPDGRPSDDRVHA